MARRLRWESEQMAEFYPEPASLHHDKVQLKKDMFAPRTEWTPSLGNLHSRHHAAGKGLSHFTYGTAEKTGSELEWPAGATALPLQAVWSEVSTYYPESQSLCSGDSTKSWNLRQHHWRDLRPKIKLSKLVMITLWSLLLYDNVSQRI